MYSYGNRQYSLGKPITTYWLVSLIFVPHVIRDLLKSFGQPVPHWLTPAIAITWIVVLVWLTIRIIRFYRPKRRPDLPSAIEITDDGILRLFHGQDMYAEIPISQIASLKDVMLEVLPWNTVNASQLTLTTPVQGFDHIYILPYLKGYSEFILKLIDFSPNLRSAHKGPEWESISSRIDSSLMILLFLAVTLLAVCIAFTVHMQMTGNGKNGALLIPWGIETGIIASLLLSVRESRRNVTLITFYPNKMQIIRSSIWYSDIHPEEITGLEIISSEKMPERFIIRTGKDSFCIASDNMKNYPELVQHIREFKEQLANSNVL